jgi:hypothetical protein
MTLILEAWVKRGGKVYEPDYLEKMQMTSKRTVRTMRKSRFTAEAEVLSLL